MEPFAGSACLFFRLAPKQALLSDLNSELMEVFNEVKTAPVAVAKILAQMPVGRESYYEVRANNTQEMTPTERAARFIYLNRFCFNGLYRTNRAGHFNVPYGSPKTSSVPSEQDLINCASVLETTILACGDFDQIIRNHAMPDDFIYLDPPYFQNTKRMFRQYLSSPFANSDLERLSRLLDHINQIGATFIVSYAYCPEALEAFSLWPNKVIRAQRNISGFAKHRGPASELVVSNRF